MTILTPEIRAALEAAGWVFESSTRATKAGDESDLMAEWEAITGQPTKAETEHEWEWCLIDGGLAWDVTNQEEAA